MDIRAFEGTESHDSRLLGKWIREVCCWYRLEYAGWDYGFFMSTKILYLSLEKYGST